MFFHASNRGFLVGLIGLGCLGLSDWLCGTSFHQPDYYSTHGWPKLAAFALAAAITWALDSRHREEAIPGAEIHSGTPTRPKPLFGPRDTLFFLPVRWWPWVYLILGVAFYFVRV